MARKYMIEGGKVKSRKGGGGVLRPDRGDDPEKSEAKTITGSSPATKSVTAGTTMIGADSGQKSRMEEELREMWVKKMGSLGNIKGGIHATLPDGSTKVVQRTRTGFTYQDPGKFEAGELQKMPTYKF